MRRGIFGIALFFLIWTSHAIAQGFDFENPNLDKPQEKKSGNDLQLGSFGGLNLGVLFDVRYLAIDGNSPGTLVHVNELNITGNIGDNISILAEQLLPTSRLSGIEDQIGDDQHDGAPRQQQQGTLARFQLADQQHEQGEEQPPIANQVSQLVG